MAADWQIASRTSAYLFLLTTTREWIKQFCPVNVKPRYGRFLSNAVTSTSSSNTAADFPPSSRMVGVKDSAQVLAIAFPVAVEPVNPTMPTSLWATNASPASREPGRTFITPAGKPASIAASAKM